MDSGLNNEKIIMYWIESSDSDFKTMSDLFNTHNNNWALFLGHLVLEKLLKALYLKHKNEFPPFIHDLRRLAEKAGLILDEERLLMLDTITRFNINARYDDYKQNFYKACNDSFTQNWIENIINCRIWIKTML